MKAPCMQHVLIPVVMQVKTKIGQRYTVKTFLFSIFWQNNHGDPFLAAISHNLWLQLHHHSRLVQQQQQQQQQQLQSSKKKKTDIYFLPHNIPKIILKIVR